LRLRYSYNGLPHVDTRFSKEIDRDSIKELLGIIIRHNLGHITAVHNLHRHDLLPAGTVRLEKNIGDVLPGAKLTPPAPVAELDFSKTHALTYVVDGNNLVSFEFEEGENSAPADAMTPEFLAEFTKFVNEKGLANIFALKIGDFTLTPRNRFAEFEIDRVGTLVVPSDNLTMTGPVTETSWDVRGYNAENSDNDGTTSYHKVSTTKDTHKVWVNSLDKSPRLIIDSLINQGIIKRPTA
jgi:hypothetical protein